MLRSLTHSTAAGHAAVAAVAPLTTPVGAPTRTYVRNLTRALALGAAVASAACSPKQESSSIADTSGASRSAGATSGAVRAADTTARGATSAVDAMMAPMGGATGNADQDFLRAMSDHHKGLILIAHHTIEHGGQLGSKPDARTLDAAQDKELDSMVTTLEQQFKDPYAPKVMTEHQAMADSLAPLNGTAYDRRFYEDVIRHHEEAVRMVDAYMPKLTQPMLRAMAAEMKAKQTAEIAEFTQKLAKLR